MIGIDYLKRLSQIMGESYPASNWMDKKTSFDYLYEAAKDFCRETRILRGSQSITTVANQANYALNPDFREVYAENDDTDKVIRYYNTAGYTWLTQQYHSATVYNNNTTAILNPTSFSITSRAAGTQLTGTATSSGAQSGGESTLTDTSASFTGSVSIGDTVYNTTSGYIGIVTGVTSGTALKTAMFDSSGQTSSYAGWSSSDAYIIQPQSRFDLYLDPMPSTSGHAVTVNYLQTPAPVYTDYGSYNLPGGFEEAILKYAVWLYKYRDTKPQIGDYLYKFYEMQVREARGVGEKALNKPTFKVSWKK